jgi:CRP-like cAMP-binding protein
MPNPQTDLLKGLPADEEARVTALGVRLTVPAGHVLFKLGDVADRVYLVARGRVALTLPLTVGGADEDVLVEERLAGETLGWSGLIPPHRFTLKAKAVPECDLLVFPRAALLDHFAVHPNVGYTVTRNLASVIGHRLEVFQTMWLREMQRVVEHRHS